MLNAIYHFDMGEVFSPYAGYGIGAAFQKHHLKDSVMDHTERLPTSLKWELTWSSRKIWAF
ncbi:MAG TPA: hypothetical protein DCM60_05255 [Nitrospina sp.]|jgi:opacity protein-like surface antigen|nr:hypothetical protein [Nitrospina sp.]|tara:strand:- start:894 stop:1076 length:183 start_codon:yes stop_codon:yes gene_type:complete